MSVLSADQTAFLLRQVDWDGIMWANYMTFCRLDPTAQAVLWLLSFGRLWAPPPIRYTNGELV